MTSDPSPASTAEELLSAFPEHAKLSAWLSGRGSDAAMAAMSASAGAKKPGHAVRRIAKMTGKLFETPRIVGWTKAEKFVYAKAITTGAEHDVLAVPAPGEADEQPALFQTDLHLRTRGEHTELDATIVAALSRPALEDILRLFAADDPIQIASKVLGLVRLMRTGLDASGIERDDRREFAIPFGERVILATNEPVDRIELGQAIPAQTLCARRVLSDAAQADQDPENLRSLASAMTREGHPGAEAFARLVRAAARPASR